MHCGVMGEVWETLLVEEPFSTLALQEVGLLGCARWRDEDGEQDGEVV